MSQIGQSALPSTHTIHSSETQGKSSKPEQPINSLYSSACSLPFSPPRIPYDPPTYISPSLALPSTFPNNATEAAVSSRVSPDSQSEAFQPARTDFLMGNTPALSYFRETCNQERTTLAGKRTVNEQTSSLSLRAVSLNSLSVLSVWSCTIGPASEP